MKKVAALTLLLEVIFAFSGMANSVPYDTAKFVCWSASNNENGEIAVAFVNKTDTTGDSLWPVRYRKYRDGAIVTDDTVMRKWKRMMNFGWARFALALDSDGWGHLVINADSNMNASNADCAYITNRPDGKWKKRYILS
jgi:hypothetical protein